MTDQPKDKLLVDRLFYSSPPRKVKTMKQIIFLSSLLILCFITGCCLLCYPIGSRSSGITLDTSNIPKKIGIKLEGLYLENPLTTKQFIEGITRLGFNIALQTQQTKDDDMKKWREGGLDGLLIATGEEIRRTGKRTSDYICRGKFTHTRVELFDIETGYAVWTGDGFGYAQTAQVALGKGTKKVLKKLKRDIKGFKGKRDGT